MAQYKHAGREIFAFFVWNRKLDKTERANRKLYVQLQLNDCMARNKLILPYCEGCKAGFI